jgi:hypothetical protein
VHEVRHVHEVRQHEVRHVHVELCAVALLIVKLGAGPSAPLYRRIQ